MSTKRTSVSEDAHRDIRLELRADYLVHGKLLLFWKKLVYAIAHM